MNSLIFNSDDFGLSKESNFAIMEGCTKGILTSTCIAANGDFYEHGVKEILPSIPNVGKGIHLNIIEGKSLTNPELFTDSAGYFNKDFLYFFFNANNKKLLNQVEAEFRAQIEKLLADVEIDHINSHVHTHAIPALFNLTIKLCLEYKIKNIRTQYERPYFVPKINKILNKRYPVNLIKTGLLNTLSHTNKKIINVLNSKSENKKISTNNYIIGVSFTGYMDKNTILCGLNALKNTQNKTVEIIVHPKNFKNNKNNLNYLEFLTVMEPNLKKDIQKAGFKLANYKNLKFE